MELAQRYEVLLSQSRGLRLIDLDRSLLRAAALLRAAYPVKTPDSIRIAAALSADCNFFLTHDRDLPAVEGIKTLRIGRYVETETRPE